MGRLDFAGQHGGACGIQSFFGSGQFADDWDGGIFLNPPQKRGCAFSKAQNSGVGGEACLFKEIHLPLLNSKDQVDQPAADACVGELAAFQLLDPLVKGSEARGQLFDSRRQLRPYFRIAFWLLLSQEAVIQKPGKIV